MAAPNSLMSPQIALMDKIKATHLSDIPRELDVAPLLLIIENIFDPAVQVDFTDAAVQSELSFLIDRLSCEISYKALSRVDSETTVLTIFNMIGTYDWHVKLVLSLAAFALNYGSFQLVNRTHSTNELAESTAKLRGLPNLFGSETLNKLINSMVKLAKCVLEFQRLPRVHISAEFPASERIKFAAYMTVKSIVNCSIYIGNIPSFVATQSPDLPHGFQLLEADLSRCAQQLITTCESLNQHLVECNAHIVTSKNDEFYEELATATNIGGMEIGSATSIGDTSNATATTIGVSGLISAGVLDTSGIAATNIESVEIGSATSIVDTSTTTATNIGASGLISAGVLDTSSIAATNIGAMAIGSATSIVDSSSAAATNFGASGLISARVLHTSSNAALNIASSGGSNAAFVGTSTIEDSNVASKTYP